LIKELSSAPKKGRGWGGGRRDWLVPDVLDCWVLDGACGLKWRTKNTARGRARLHEEGRGAAPVTGRESGKRKGYIGAPGGAELARKILISPSSLRTTVIGESRETTRRRERFRIQREEAVRDARRIMDAR